MTMSATEITAQAARRVRGRILAILVLLAVLATATLGGVRYFVLQQAQDTNAASQALRARQLSQQIASEIALLNSLAATPERTSAQAKLRQDLLDWEQVQKSLLNGNDQLALVKRTNPREISVLTAGLNLQHSLNALAQQTLALSAPDANTVSVNQQIGHFRSDYDRLMDTAISLLQTESETDARQSLILEVVLGIGIALTVGMIGLLVFTGTALTDQLLLGLQRRRREMETLFAVNPTALMLVDRETLEIVRCNQRCAQLLGARIEEIVSQSITAFINPLHEKSQQALDSMRNGEIDSSEIELSLLDGEHSTFETTTHCGIVSFHDRPAYLLALSSIAELKKSQEALHFHATFDELTGLVNRRAGLLMLEKEMARSERDSMPLSICFIDIDGLKAVNDEYGHEEGDWLLVKASEILAESIRMGDEAIRLGGDEFLLVMHNCPEENSRILAERIEQKMEEIGTNGGKAFHPTISIGLATYNPTRHGKVHQFIAEADRKMFLRKQSRKDQFSGKF